MQNSLEQLLDEVDEFMRTAGYSDTRFGEACLNDRHLIHRLRKGSDIKLSTVDKIREFMAKENAKLLKAAKRKAARDKATIRRAGRKAAERKRSKGDNRRTSAI